jgi:hypothetical protein
MTARFATIFAASLVALTSGSLAADEGYTLPDDFDRQAMETIAVGLIDDAKDGCWTNLIEVRSYAEGRVTEAGLRVDPESPYTLLISMQANRPEGGPCVGMAEASIEMAATGIPQELYGQMILLSTRAVLMSEDNLNQSLLEGVRLITEALAP